MSNVLIGIIGVILFIGLALAGALFLGPRFQESTTNAKTSAVVSSMQQIANAANLYRLENGAGIAPGAPLVSPLVASGYLKAAPGSPFAPEGATADTVFRGADERGNTTQPLRMVYSSLGSTDQAKDACAAIERQFGNPNPSAVVDTPTAFGPRAIAIGRSGCMNDADAPGSYTAFILI